MKNQFLFLLMVITLSFSSCGQQSASKLVSAEEFKAKTAEKGVQIIDVRTADEFSGGHIEKAVNIDFFAADFKAQIEKLDKTKPVLVYCQAGGRSAKASVLFKEAGFKLIYELKGGYGSYQN